jgi:hypothetical protein
LTIFEAELRGSLWNSSQLAFRGLLVYTISSIEQKPTPFLSRAQGMRVNMRSLLFLTLPLLTLADWAPSWCPGGTWVDQNGGCHFGSRPSGEPIGWIDRNGHRILPQIWPNNRPPSGFPGSTTTVTYDLPDGTHVILPANKRYSRSNNPGVFFDARWQDTRDVQPLRDGRGAIPYLDGVNWWLAKRMRLVHGVLSAIAFVVLFPLGAIVVNMGSGMVGTGGHVVLQVLGWLFYLVGAAAGLWIASVIRWRGFSFVSFSSCFFATV